MPFLHDDFLLTTAAARRLYHDYAAPQPIYDYHSHLPPADLANNRTFANLHEAWLEGDHYKWRAMRAHGVEEQFVMGLPGDASGGADPLGKFRAFARTVPATLGNPLHHWTHLELRRCFGIDTLLCGDTADEIWQEANRQLASMPVSAFLERFNVRLVGTTDDPSDVLEHHTALNNNPLPQTKVVPTFRPDPVYNTTHNPRAWNAYVDRLGESAGVKIKKLDDLLDAFAKRHGFFHGVGSRISDHGFACFPDLDCSDADARDIFDRLRGSGAADTASGRDDGQPGVSELHQQKWRMYLMLFFGRLDVQAGWTKQLHLGPMRNNNGWAYEHLGPDAGFDSFADYTQGPGLKRYLSTLAQRGHLPQTVLYNLNPADNYLFATMVGNFNLNVGGSREGRPAKMQFGSGWWFNDQKYGMRDQMRALANTGLLPHFIGMLTDSRSFLSFPRHEYFRRTLCGLLGEDLENGELPDDFELIGKVVEDICYGNAERYFEM